MEVTKAPSPVVELYSVTILKAWCLTEGNVAMINVKVVMGRRKERLTWYCETSLTKDGTGISQERGCTGMKRMEESQSGDGCKDLSVYLIFPASRKCLAHNKSSVKSLSKCMDGWLDRWVGGWVSEWTDKTVKKFRQDNMRGTWV